MKPKKPQTLSDQLRRIIADCGMSRYEIAKRSGVPEAALSRFFNGKTGLTTDTLDRLAPALGLHLVADADAKPLEPTPENLARPMLAKKPKAKRTRRSGKTDKAK